MHTKGTDHKFIIRTFSQKGYTCITRWPSQETKCLQALFHQILFLTFYTWFWWAYVWLTIREELLSQGICVIYPQEELPNSFPKWLHQCTLLPLVYVSSTCSTSCQYLPIVMPFLRNEFSYFSFICRKFGGRGKKRTFVPSFLYILVAPETFRVLPLQIFHLSQYCQVDDYRSLVEESERAAPGRLPGHKFAKMLQLKMTVLPPEVWQFNCALLRSKDYCPSTS